MNKKTTLLVLLAGFLFGGAAAGGILWFQTQKKASPKVQSEETAPQKGKPVAHRGKKQQKHVKEVATRQPRPKSQFTNSVPPMFRQDVEDLRNALDDENHQKIVDAAKHLLASDRKEIRVEAADALCYAGWEGLSLLTSLLIDDDPDVAESARTSFDFSLFEMEDQKAKQKLLSVAAELAAPADPAYFNELLTSYSMESSDAQMVDLAAGMYNDNLPDESKRAIFQSIQDVTFSDPITNIEDGRKEIEKWKTENADWIKTQESMDWGGDF